jgi:hypothetical protein
MAQPSTSLGKSCVRQVLQTEHGWSVHPFVRPRRLSLRPGLSVVDFAAVEVNVDAAHGKYRHGCRPNIAADDEVGAKNLALYTDDKAAVVQSLKQAGKLLGLPTTILIGKDGCELGTLAGPAQWDSPNAFALFEAIHG